VNQIVVCGNIGEPKMNFTKGGKAVLSFGLATNRKIGEEVVTVWHNIKCWDTLAENLAAEVSKGDRLIVAGRIDSEKWTDKEGNERTTTVIVADEAGKSLRWVKN
jgi:single-strand DNA-binding protein